MKQILGAAALAAWSVAACAQSSVTLYGRIDTGLEYQSAVPTGPNASASRIRVESGDLGTSLWGLKGVEDLGGGYQALFQLEDGIDTANGTSSDGKAFSRYADVGLSSPDYGTILLGNQLWLSNSQLWPFDPLGQSNWSSASLSRGRNWPILSNTATWESPNWDGLNITSMYALGNQPDFNAGTIDPVTGATVDPGRSDGVSVTYTNTLYELIGMFDEIRDGNGAFSDVFAYSRQYTAGVNLFLGQFKLQAVYESSHANAALAGAPTEAQQEWGGITYTVNPALSVIGAVYHVDTNGSTDGAGHATLYTLGGNYNLSKRTLIGFQVATIHNSSNSDFGLNANYPIAGSDDPLAGHSQSGAYVDLQHSF